MIKEQLIQARELIQAENYDDARALLNTIDHPKAREWLARLDTIAPVDAAYQEEVRVHNAFLHARELIQAGQYADARAVLNTLDHPTAREWLAKLDSLAPQTPPENVAESPEMEMPMMARPRPRRRPFPVMAALLVALVIGGAALILMLRGNGSVDTASPAAQAIVPHGAYDFKALAGYFPNDTVVYTGFRVDDGLIDRIDALYVKLVGKIGSETIPMLPRLRTMIDLLVINTSGGRFETDLRSWVGDTMAVGIYDVKRAAQEAVSGTDIGALPGLAVVIQVTDRAAAIAYVNKLNDRMNKTSAQANTLTQSDWNGFTRIDVSDTRRDAPVVLVNDSIMIITFREEVDDFAALPAQPLSQNAGFNETLDMLPAGSYDIVTYLDIVDLIRSLLPVYEKMVNQTIPLFTDMVNRYGQEATPIPEIHFVDTFNKLLDIDARLALGAVLSGDSLVFDAVTNSIDIQTLTDIGIVIPYSAPVDRSFLARVPAGASVVVHGTDLKAQNAANEANTRVQIEWLNKLNIPGVSPNAPFVNMPQNTNTVASLQEQLTQQFPQLNLDLQADLLDWLSGDYVYFMTYTPLTDPMAYIGAQNIVNGGVIIEAVDPAKASQFVEKIAAAALAQTPTQAHRETIAGVNALVVPVPMQDGSTLELVIGANDRVFYAGTKSSAEQVFNGTGGFGSEPEYTAASSYFVANSTGYAYSSRGGMLFLGDLLLAMGHQMETLTQNMAAGLDTPPPAPRDNSAFYAQAQDIAQTIVSLFESASTSTHSSAEGDMVSRTVITFAK